MDWPVSSQPQSAAVSSDAAEWASGICDCCQDMKQCCFAFWCFPCFACKTSKDFDQCLCLPLLDICGGCVFPASMSMRTYVRLRYGIKGTLCNDCVCSTFCLPCVWCQMATERKKREIPTVLGDIISRW
ncbi:cornifelin homolog B-like [Mugil cephalus]|uniref:cornifelin homolog B-like n=1 Tax=Mugil cephalus TaxID=48193 RepID=UPI001FB708F3|nr:cornifelin homolog B-like [Mugil cephalus]